jgi:acetyltransferase
MVDNLQSLKFKTKSGREVMARPLTAYDAPFLVDIFEHMSPESRYRRFQQALENPNPKQIWEEAEKIVQMDEEEQDGFIAFRPRPLRPDVPVAAARFVYVDETTAEIALSVIDGMQGQGVGSWLLGLTVERARSRGIQKLVGSALNDNEIIWHLLDKLPYPYRRTPDGLISEIEIDLSR